MFKLSQLFNPINYNAPELSPQVKEHIFSVIDEKTKRGIYFKKLRTILIPIGSTFVLGFIVANNLNYFNIGKPVEVYIKSVNTEQLRGKTEIVAALVETGIETGLDMGPEIIVPSKNNKKEIIPDNKLEIFAMKKAPEPEKPVANDMDQLNQIMKSTLPSDEPQDMTLDDLEAVVEIETQLSNSLGNSIAPTGAPQETMMADTAVEKADLMIVGKSSITYYETKIRNTIYVKNNGGTIGAGTVISIYCSKDAISFTFSKNLTSDLDNGAEFLMKKDITDTYILSVLFGYFDENNSVDLICTVNKTKTIEEKNYNNNESAISITKTF